MIVDELYEFVIDVCDSLTIDELLTLQSATGDWDRFHTLCSENEMIQHAVFGTEGEHDDSIDNYIQVLEHTNKKYKDTVDDDHLMDFVTKFKELVDNNEDAIWYSMLTNSKYIKQILVKHFPLLGIKIISDYLHERIKDFSLKNEDFETRLMCECGKFYKHKVKREDVRHIISCCTTCGRGMDKFKVVAARDVMLVETVTKKKWWRMITTTEKRSLGLELSKYDIVDHKYSEFQPAPTIPSKASIKPKKKKTLLQG